MAAIIKMIEILKWIKQENANKINAWAAILKSEKYSNNGYSVSRKYNFNENVKVMTQYKNNQVEICNANTI